MSNQNTQVDRLINRIKNNRATAILIVFGVSIIAISSFTDATHKIFIQIQEFLSNRATIVTLRREPQTLSSDNVKTLLVKYGFYDKRWNASGKGIAHRFESQIKGNVVIVHDAATDLMWQKSGSSNPMKFTDAEQYVGRLNAEKFAGYNDWHLPTVEEAMSLMEPQAYDSLHIDPEFERGADIMWTSDRATDGRIWMLYFYNGIISLEPGSFNAWVRVTR